MKKITVLTFVLLSQFILAQQTYVPDDNFEQRLIELGYDTVLDNYVTTSNINTITVLYIDGENISSLEGIEDFTALESLNAYNNNITSVDVTDLSNLEEFSFRNNLLTSVDFSGNPKLRQAWVQNASSTQSQNNITTLDFSNNPLLEEIRCDNNNITSINISSSPLIDAIYCSGNNLTSLDVSHLSSLTILDCSDNQLTYLDVRNGNNANISNTNFKTTGNSGLTCISVDSASYSGGAWTTYVDDSVSSFDEHCFESYIPDDNFEAYLEANNMGNGRLNDDYVSTANISGVTVLSVSSQNIADMSGIEHFSALEELDTNNNNLTTLDLSNNLTLKEVRCYNNDLTSISLGNNINLEEYRCYGNKLQSLDVSALTSLQVLSCSNNLFTELDLSSNTALREVFAYDGLLTSIDISNNPNLYFINVRDNALTSIDASDCIAMTRLFANNNNLSTLDVKNGNNTNVTSFNATGNTNLTCINVDDIDASNFSSWNKDGGATFDAHCYETYVPDDNFEAYLETHTSIGIEINPLFNSGVATMGNGIDNDNYVSTEQIQLATTLSVFNETIADFTGLEEFTLLESFTSASNTMSTLDLSKNTNLTTISVAFNSNLATINLTGLTALKNLNLKNNALTSVDLSQHTNLETVDVSNNNLTYLNLENGNNTLMNNSSDVNVTGNSNLSCIHVDDASFSTMTWTNIDNDTSSFSEHCDDTYVPDDNFEQELIDLGYDTGALDDYVPTANINAITTLYIGGKGIADFTGIEDFVGLTIFDPNNNPCTTIDVSSLVNLETFTPHSTSSLTSVTTTGLTKLTYLRVNNTSITSLDISTNIALERLWAFNLPSIPGIIDTTNNTLLSQLVISNSGLEGALDISHLSSLTYLEVRDNNLSSINMANGNNTNVTFFNTTGNSSLTCITVDSEDYSNSNWDGIDVGTASFSELECPSGVLDMVIQEDDPFAKFSVYPNPAKNYITISATSGSLEKVEFYTVLGQIKLTKTDNFENIDISHLESGVYFIKMYTDKGIENLKIIKK